MNSELKNRSDFKQQFKKRCFVFSISILRLTDELSKKNNNQIIANQLTRAATSIGANVVEGGNSTSKREFINFFQISLKSASETIYWLALLKEINLADSLKINGLIQECIELKKILSTVILNTKENSRF